VLALPAFAWAGAGYEWFLADCDAYDCGDRVQASFMVVLLTAPLIPVGAVLAARDLEQPTWLTRLGRLGCALVEGVFGLLALASAALATGLTESGRDSSVTWLVLAGFCLAIVLFVERVRRRLPRT
jgi:hypothetical protein